MATSRRGWFIVGFFVLLFAGLIGLPFARGVWRVLFFAPVLALLLLAGPGAWRR
jgi:hypothetical protein